MKIIKQTIITLIYTLTLAFVLYLNNLGLVWVITNILTDLFEWFYNIHFLWKILLIFVGGTVIITIILSLFKSISAIISTFLNIIFPYNKAMKIISYILCFWNIIILEIAFWPFLSFDFWIICMWLIISFFIIETNIIFIYKDFENEF